MSNTLRNAPEFEQRGRTRALASQRERAERSASRGAVADYATDIYAASVASFDAAERRRLRRLATDLGRFA